jgi:RNase H-fold protein (predicted Holliday junction resolvase)
MKNLKHSIEIAWDDQKLIKTPEILKSIDEVISRLDSASACIILDSFLTQKKFK